MFPFLNLNGKIVPANQPHFFSANRSLRYGDGLFEGMRILNGEFLFFEDHLTRLFDGMKVLGIIPAENFSPAYFFTIISELLVANKVQEDVLVRIHVYRSGGGLYEPVTDEAEFFIEILKAPADGFQWNDKGISIGIFKEWRKEINPSSPFKAGNAQVYVMASRWKKQNGLDDAIVLNAKGNVCDATSSNIFMVKNGKLVTPALAEGAVRGVTRKNLIQFTHDLQGFKKPEGLIAEERNVTEEELINADEIFLTNISKGIRRVESLAGKKYKCDLTRQLADRFYEQVRKKE